MYRLHDKKSSKMQTVQFPLADFLAQFSLTLNANPEICANEQTII